MNELFLFVAKVLFFGVVLQVLTMVGCVAHHTQPMQGPYLGCTPRSWKFSMGLSFVYLLILTGSPE